VAWGAIAENGLGAFRAVRTNSGGSLVWNGARLA
jgi:hypothetical protein